MDVLDIDPVHRYGMLPAARLHALSLDPPGALSAIELARWPSGLTCGWCGSPRAARVTGKKTADRNRLHCSACNKQSSWRTGTAFARSRSLPEHIAAATALALDGLSRDRISVELARQFGFGRDRSAKLLVSIAVAFGIEERQPIAPPAVITFMEPRPIEVTIQAAASADVGIAVLHPPAPDIGEAWLESDPAGASAGPRKHWRVKAALAVFLALALVGLAARRSVYRAELNTSWVHNGRSRTWTTTRGPDEAYAEFVTRHNADVAALYQRLQPDDDD